MNIELYKTESSRNKINKVLNTSTIIQAKLLNDINLLNPTMILQDINNDFLTNYNYCYIPYFNRYYFIESMNKNINGLITIRLSVDVLMSFANDIKNSYATIIESENPNEKSINHTHSDNVRKLIYNYTDKFDHIGKLYLTASYAIN